MKNPTNNAPRVYTRKTQALELLNRAASMAEMALNQADVGAMTIDDLRNLLARLIEHDNAQGPRVVFSNAASLASIINQFPDARSILWSTEVVAGSDLQLARASGYQTMFLVHRMRPLIFLYQHDVEGVVLDTFRHATDNDDIAELVTKIGGVVMDVIPF
jgi:hypothetical protein